MDFNTKFEPIRIKKSRTLIPFLSFMCLVIAAASVYCALLPFIYDIEQPYNYIYTIVGGIGSVYFLIMMFSYIYTLFVPKNALIVSNEGFLDLINCGSGIGVVTWDNVEKVELCGTEEHPYIGIFIKNSDELIKSKSKKSLKPYLHVPKTKCRKS